MAFRGGYTSKILKTAFLPSTTSQHPNYYNQWNHQGNWQCHMPTMKDNASYASSSGANSTLKQQNTINNNSNNSNNNPKKELSDAHLDSFVAIVFLLFWACHGNVLLWIDLSNNNHQRELRKTFKLQFNLIFLFVCLWCNPPRQNSKVSKGPVTSDIKNGTKQLRAYLCCNYC